MWTSAILVAPIWASYAAATVGKACVVNNCPYKVHLCNVPASGGGYTQIDRTLEPSGGHYEQEYTPLTNSHGWSIKLSRDGTYGSNLLQYEYCYQRDETIWFDMSQVDGKPWDNDWEVTADGAGCEPHQRAYRFWNDDANGMQSCSAAATVTLTLCSRSGSGGGPPAAAAGAASEGSPRGPPAGLPAAAAKKEDDEADVQPAQEEEEEEKRPPPPPADQHPPPPPAGAYRPPVANLVDPNAGTMPDGSPVVGSSGAGGDFVDVVDGVVIKHETVTVMASQPSPAPPAPVYRRHVHHPHHPHKRHV